MESSHSSSVEEVVRSLGTDLKNGLTTDQATSLVQRYGPNELPEQESDPWWKRFLEQFDDKLVKILLGAAVVSLLLALENTFVAVYNREDFFSPLLKAFYDGEFVEAGVIMLILVLNAIVGVWQESNADKAIEALKEYAAPLAKCCRNGEVNTIRASELVPGDIVEVAAGDKVPADIRCAEFHSTAVKVEQMVLTGESAAVNKQLEAVHRDADLTDKKNILFSGTDLVYGKVRGVVVMTGQSTLIGTLHKGLQTAEEKDSPLKEKLDKFGDLLTNVIMVICVLVWLIHLGDFSAHSGSWFRGAIYYFKIAVALAVAAIPEGLPAVVTTCLALGTRRMAQKNAIVRHLPSVETLGCTQVICSDKTGTLTTNQMSVMRIFVSGSKDLDGVEYEVEGVSFEPKGSIFQYKNNSRGSQLATPFEDDALREVAKIGCLCNQAKIEFNTEKQVWQRQGESTEAALKVLAEKIGAPDVVSGSNKTPASDYWNSQYTTLTTLEFARDRKSMSVLVSESSAASGPASATKRIQTRSSARATKSQQLLVKGAPESILERCTHIKRSGKEDPEPLTPPMRQYLLKKAEKDYGSGAFALRCLALAYVPNCDPSPESMQNPANFAKIESNMVFVGLVGIRDPPRPEVAGAIEKCHRAGIRVIIITGDNKTTAESIARQIGIFHDGEDLSEKSYTGAEFSAMSEREQIAAVKRASLFSRTEPTHKQKLVEILQTHHHCVTAMTGDGVNDAPALKAADIGIAMGSGTAVAKEASRMVLADDNFTTIVNAVEEGRAIYNNTKAFIRYLISSNIGEVVCIFLAAALLIPEPLEPVTLLWVNLVTDGLPATALSFNPPESDVMNKPPRKRNEEIVDKWGFFRYMVIGCYVGLATVMGYIWWQCYYEEGPMVTFSQLRQWSKCKELGGFDLKAPFDCSVDASNPFLNHRPMTVSLSILVTIEMFNALNALAENDSLLSTPPWVNPWLVGAIALSFLQHFIILYTSLGSAFSVTPLNFTEWKMVVAISAPIILIDEVLKFVARSRESAKRSKENNENEITTSTTATTTKDGRSYMQIPMRTMNLGEVDEDKKRG